MQMNSVEFHILAGILVTCNHKMPAERYIRPASNLYPSEIHIRVLCRLVSDKFGANLVEAEVKNDLADMETVGELASYIKARMRSLILDQDTARKLYDALKVIRSLDLKSHQVVFKVQARRALQFTENVPVRFRWVSMHSLPEVLIEFRPSDMTMEEVGDERNESYATLADFANAYGLEA